MRIEEEVGWFDNVYTITASGTAMSSCDSYFCALPVSTCGDLLYMVFFVLMVWDSDAQLRLLLACAGL